MNNQELKKTYRIYTRALNIGNLRTALEQNQVLCEEIFRKYIQAPKISKDCYRKELDRLVELSQRLSWNINLNIQNKS